MSEPSPAAFAVVLLPAGVAAWLGTAAVRRYALSRSLLDHPNERSSHAVATPRGGGMAIALVTLGGLAALGGAGVLPWRLTLALVVGGAAVAAVGWLDDHRPLRAAARVTVHFAAAAWALYWLGGVPRLTVGARALPLGVAGVLLGALGIVWLINLYNFMDGIDGIAAGEAVAVGAAGGGLLVLGGAPGLGLAALLTAAAAAGFLAWNWAPARIFMGDVGSGLLGFLFAALAVASENAGALPLLVWLLLGAVFVVDATLTLVRRLLRRERVYQPHRSHAYQRAVQAVGSHAQVSLAVLALNLLLAALALAVTLRPALLLPALAVGVALVVAAYLCVERARPMR